MSLTIGQKVFYKQTADHIDKKNLGACTSAWNRIPYNQTHLFDIVTMSGNIELQLIAFQPGVAGIQDQSPS